MSRVRTPIRLRGDAEPHVRLRGSSFSSKKRRSTAASSSGSRISPSTTRPARESVRGRAAGARDGRSCSTHDRGGDLRGADLEADDLAARPRPCRRRGRASSGPSACRPAARLRRRPLALAPGRGSRGDDVGGPLVLGSGATSAGSASRSRPIEHGGLVGECRRRARRVVDRRKSGSSSTRRRARRSRDRRTGSRRELLDHRLVGQRLVDELERPRARRPARPGRRRRRPGRALDEVGDRRRLVRDGPHDGLGGRRQRLLVQLDRGGLVVGVGADPRRPARQQARAPARRPRRRPDRAAAAAEAQLALEERDGLACRASDGDAGSAATASTAGSSDRLGGAVATSRLRPNVISRL